VVRVRVLLFVAGLLFHAPLMAQTPAPTQADAVGFESLQAQAGRAREAGRLDEAVRLYQKAVALRPDWAEGWWYLGTLLYDQDAFAGAAGALAQAVKLNPKSGTAVAMLGLCEAKLGRNRDALAHLDTDAPQIVVELAQASDARRILEFRT